MLYYDITKLILSFIFSSLQQLRFDKCKNILGKLEELEKHICELLPVKETSKLPSFSSLNTSFMADTVTSTSRITLCPETREPSAVRSRRTSIMSIFHSKHLRKL